MMKANVEHANLILTKALDILEAPSDVRLLITELIWSKEHYEKPIFNSCFKKFTDWFFPKQDENHRLFLEVSKQFKDPAEYLAFLGRGKMQAGLAILGFLVQLNDPYITFLDGEGKDNITVDANGRIITRRAPKLEVEGLWLPGELKC
jgi:hypothetical protein